MKRAEYKVATSTNGLPELEKRVSELLSDGWKPLGGISFNQGYPYQALAKIVTVTNERKETKTANQAMMMVDELT